MNKSVEEATTKINTDDNETEQIKKKKKKKRKRKKQSYKSILFDILKPKENKEEKDKKRIKNNLGGGVYQKVIKI